MSGRTTPSGIPSSSSRSISSPGGPKPASTANTSATATSTSVQVALRVRPPPSHEAASNIPSRFQRSVVQPTPGSSTSLTVEAPPIGGKGPAKQSFAFDRVLGPEDGQSKMYDHVEPLVYRFLEGYNVTVLAYGQTSSGKSYTMGTDMTSMSSAEIEDEQRIGIIPRAVNQIFHEISQRIASAGSNRLKISAQNSYIEIYNEELIDLLVGDSYGAEKPIVQIREDKAGHIIWSGLREIPVTNASDVMQNLEAGSSIRQTGQTAMNDQSSRSHAIFSLTLTQQKYTGQNSPRPDKHSPPTSHTNVFGTPSRSAAHRQSGIPSSMGRVSSPVPGSRPSTPSAPGERRLLPRPSSSLRDSRATSPAPKDDDDRHTPSSSDGEWVTVTSKFHWVDLAGSERLKRTSAMGERAKEGISINAGLLALGNVISALGDPAKARQTTHIPYRDSKLTRLLQDSLGGNAHTLMIACVSPAEANLSETLNTLKYANRARNIKNRAELNEVEIGWDDVEHLQKLVLRLRSEAAALKDGHMPAISEEASSLRSPLFPSGLPGGDVFSLQEQYSELSTKYAKLTAELAKAHSSPQSMSAESFAMAVEPVVEEYEKSISALESQLSLSKAALSHAEEIMQERDDKLNFESQVNESNARLIGDLKSRLAKVSERESVTENYIQDLEARLKATTDVGEKASAQVAELRRELSKYRETEGNTEKYVKELEARLSKSEESQRLQKAQVETLERDVQRTERAYAELESRLALLDTSDQHKQLLAELDERDKQVLGLQHDLDIAKKSLAVLEQSSARLANNAASEREERQELRKKVEAMEQKTQQSPQPEMLGTSLPKSLDGLTPPQTPAEPPSVAVDEGTPRMPASSDPQQDDLEEKYARTLAELEQITSKYQESLREIGQLQQQRPRVHRRKTSASSETPDSQASSPKSSTSASKEEVEENQDSVDNLPVAPSYTTPARGQRTSRRSMPLSPRASFLGRSPAQSTSASHLRSVSLSQELHWAQSLNSFQGLTSGGPMSPRSTSPLFSKRDSLLALQPTAPSERSNETLLQEVKKLQETLREREEEIRALETLMSQLRDGTGPPSLRDNLAVQAKFTADDTLRTPVGEKEPDVFSLSPNAMAAFDAIKSGLHNQQNSSADLASEEQLARLDDLMLSMARKEVAHKEQVDELKEQLAGSRRQHDDLKALAKDQLANLASEMTALREELEARSKAAQEHEKNLKTLAQQVADQEAEIARATQESHHKLTEAEEHARRMLVERDEGHAQEKLQLQEEHANMLRRMLENKEELFFRKAEEHDQALQQADLEHQEQLKNATHDHQAALSALKAEHEAALRRKSIEHAEAIKRLELQQEVSTDMDKQTLLENTTKQHKDALTAREAEHASFTEQLKADHSALLTQEREERARTIKEMQEQHENSLIKIFEEHGSLLQDLRDQRDALVEQSDLQNQAALSQLALVHQAELSDHKEEHARAITSIRSEHADTIKDLKQEHESTLARFAADHAAESASSSQSAAQKQATTEQEHQAALQAVSSSHDAALQQLASEHAEYLSELQSSHATKLAELESGYEQVLLDKAKEAEQALTALQSQRGLEADDLLAKAGDEHAKAVLDLKASHSAGLADLAASHKIALSLVREQYEAALAEQKGSSAAVIEEARRAHSDELVRLQHDLESKEAQAAQHKAEIQQFKATLETASAEQDAYAKQISELSTQTQAQGSQQAEIDRLKRSLEVTQISETALSNELQEALDALGTLEKALIESQDERERLMGDMHDLQKRNKRASSLAAELNASVKDREVLQAEVKRLELLVSDLSRRKDTSSMLGLGIGGQSSSEGMVRAASSTSDLELYTDAPTSIAAAAPSSTPSLPYPPARHSSVAHLINGSQPPPTPPPNHPPPPLPTEVLQRNNSIGIPASGSGSSQARASISSAYTKDSHAETLATSRRTDSVSGDTISVDPRVHRKLEEQEAQLVKMTKQLTHCETELQANIDLVNTLESAVQDYERSMRKTRLQMNDLSKERDSYQRQNDQLRNQINEAQREVDNARHSLQVHEQEQKMKSENQARIQAEAQRNAEARMAEMQRMNRKSKFNCF